MRRTLLSLLVAALAVTVVATPAVAGGKARPAKAGGGCKPVVAYVFEGTVAAVDAGSVTVDVVAANKHAQRFGSVATLSVDAATKVVRDDVRATLADVQAGDEANVQAMACKTVDPATTTLVARRLVATTPVVEEEPVVEEPEDTGAI